MEGLTDKAELTWTHNPDLHRWEIGYHDPIRQMTHDDGWTMLSWVTDDITLRLAMNREQIDRYITARYGVPLPGEAFAEGRLSA